MSFKATLTIVSKDYDVIAADYSLRRDFDASGRPSGAIKGGTVTVTIEANADTALLESMINNQHKPINGVVTFKKSNEDAKLKTLSFENAFIVSFRENFDSSGSNAMQTICVFSAEKITIGGAKHVNDWPK